MKEVYKSIMDNANAMVERLKQSYIKAGIDVENPTTESDIKAAGRYKSDKEFILNTAQKTWNDYIKMMKASGLA